MKTDGLFTVHNFTIPARSSQTFRLVFFGDVHRDSPNHASRTWQEFLIAEQERGKRTPSYYFGMGDYFDSTSTTERECLETIWHKLHETVRDDINKLMRAKVEHVLAKELAFMRGRIIGLLGGNHFWRFQHGGTTDTELARLLDTTYLGACAMVRIYVDICGRRSSFDIFAHHGAGGARLFGGSINRVDQLREYVNATVFVMGHDHKRGGVPATPRLFLDHSSRNGLKVRQQQQWLLRSGSFLASYEPGTSNYNVDAARGPCSLGHVELLITPHEAERTENGKRFHNPTELEIHSLT